MLSSLLGKTVLGPTDPGGSWMLAQGSEHPLSRDQLQALRDMAAGRKVIDQDLVVGILRRVLGLSLVGMWGPVMSLREVELGGGEAHAFRVTTLPTYEAPLLSWWLFVAEGKLHLERLVIPTDPALGPFDPDAVMAKQIPTSAGLAGCVGPFLELLAARGIPRDHAWLTY